MESPRRGQLSGATELPPYRALLVVDVKDFSSIPGRHHAELTDEIPHILGPAFIRAGLDELWDERRWYGTTGDGCVYGFRPVNLPFLLNPFLAALQEELEFRNRSGRDQRFGQAIRMRVSVSVGPVTDSGTNMLSEGSGHARIEIHRLLDANPVKDLLTRSGDVTRVAAIVSARAYEDAVQSGYCGEDPSLYVPAPVQVKSYQGTAYLRVPTPSGGLLTEGFRPDGEGPATGSARPGNAEEQDPTATNAAHDRNSTVRDQNKVINVQRSRDIQYFANVITGTSGPIHAGSGGQFNAPAPRRRKRTRDDD